MSECREIRPGTLGYQMCWLEHGHGGRHRPHDGWEWPALEAAEDLRFRDCRAGKGEA